MAFVLSGLGDVPVECTCVFIGINVRASTSDFVNLEDLSAQFPKMLLGVRFARLCS
jgi:hypothetical protein